MTVLRAAIILLALLQVLAVATPDPKQQCKDTNDVGGFFLELLLTHLAESEQRIQGSLEELSKSVTEQLKQLQSTVDKRDQREHMAPTSATHNAIVRMDAMKDLREQGSGVRTIAIGQVNVSYWIEIIDNFTDDPHIEGEWIVLQSRFDGSLSFIRLFNEYREGFGQLGSEQWLGLEKLRLLLSRKRHELLILVKSVYGENGYVHYDDFRIGNKTEGYRIEALGEFSGNDGYIFKYPSSSKFATRDHNNEPSKYAKSELKSGWWHNSYFFDCNLNGGYNRMHPFGKRFAINCFGDDAALQTRLSSTKMLIRPHVERDPNNLSL